MMSMRVWHWRIGFILLGLSVQACHLTPSLHAAGPKWIDGQTGNLIALKVKAGECQEEQAVLVESQWAALIVWQDNFRFFCLYDNRSRTSLATESWSKFLAALRSVPKGAQLQGFLKCSAPWDHAMPDSERDRLRRDMKARGLSWREIEVDELSTQMVCIHGGGVDFPPQ